MGLTHNQIIRDIQLKKLSPIYFLSGEEPFFIDLIAESIENDILDESEKGFGLTIAYGRDSELKNILNMAKGFPMMGNYQVIIVREAQDLKEWKKAESLKSLESYLDNPTPTTILCFAFKGKLDGRLAISKAIDKKTVSFVSNKFKDYLVSDWILETVKTKGYSIQKNIADLLAEYLGNDLSKIINEINKLAIIFPPGTEITGQIVQDYIGISKDYNSFELLRALLEKNVVQANRIVEYFIRNPKNNPIPMLIGLLFSQFNKYNIYVSAENKTHTAQLMKLNSFSIKDYQLAAKNFTPAKMDRIIGYLHDADKKSKGIGAGNMTDGEILLELIFKIMH
jgi:DNA polymerase III subunit delta